MPKHLSKDVNGIWTPIDDYIDFQEGPGVRKYQYRETGIKLLNGSNINDNILDLSNTERYISEEEAYGKYKHFLVDAGDLLIASSGIVVDKFDKKIAYAKKEHLPLCMNTSTIRFKSKDESKLHLNYFRHFLATNYFKKQLGRLITGSAQLNFGPSHLKQMYVPLPSLEEQKRIAAILDKADAIRRKRQQAIDLTDQLLRSVFLDMFGDPVTNPKGWDTLKLGDCTYLDAKMVDPKRDDYKQLKHVGAERIEKNTGKIKECLTAQEDNLISNKFLFNDRYILYTKIRPYLRKVALPDFTGLCSADIYPVRPDKNFITKEYLWFILISEAFVKYTESLPSRANIPKINRKEFALYKIMIPPIELQEEFSKIFIDMTRGNQQRIAFVKNSDDMFASLAQLAFRGDLTKQAKAA